MFNVDVNILIDINDFMTSKVEGLEKLKIFHFKLKEGLNFKLLKTVKMQKLHIHIYIYIIIYYITHILCIIYYILYIYIYIYISTLNAKWVLEFYMSWFVFCWFSYKKVI